ncbi:winged helix DNA-binding domain-containing protein [Nonomuraea sp. NPDC050790]|uniref:winged helix DNA-binding domain-containing protein n=1 Tax=Nonomuraea sp. NPDC050790 TaxID=3364371 RepID=UPI0037A2E0F8
MRSVEAQLIHRPAGREAGEVVRHLLAVQAQDVGAAQLALRARSATVTRAGIDAAVERREIVRAWGPRGTLHYIHHDDLPWLLALTSRRTGSLLRLSQEGVRGDDLLPLIEGALYGQGPLTKAELEERLGGRASGQGIVHLVGLAASHGLAVLGPLRGGKPTYVHAADWLGGPIVFEADRDRALAELAVRYRRSHVPAGPEDLAAWSGVPLGAAREGWKATTEPVPQEPVGVVRLLPAFDEFLMGWKSRDPVLAPEHARAVFPGGGILRPSVLVDGRVRGTWSRKGSAVTVEPFDELPPLDDEIAEIRQFLA